MEARETTASDEVRILRVQNEEIRRLAELQAREIQDLRSQLAEIRAQFYRSTRRREDNPAPLGACL
jgi:hypothetical protein